MFILINLMMCVMTMTVAGPVESIDSMSYNVNETLKPTRRILQGRQVGDTRPYMVYLRSATNTDPKFSGSDWICGGVIIHERYILTSAACIEDAKHFYVVSGTHKWVPLSEKNNECINNGAKKAVWKCVPKYNWCPSSCTVTSTSCGNLMFWPPYVDDLIFFDFLENAYVYDGDEFDNIRWMIGDIAVVKVEDAFNFEKRVRGCDFIPKKVDYNNRSIDLEKQRSFGSIAGWGSTDTFGDVVQDPTMLRTSINSPELLEADVQLVASKNCKKRWEPRYHFVIDEHMVCTKDITDEAMSSLCMEREVNCKELQYSDSDDDYADEDPNAPKPAEHASRRMVAEPGQLQVHTGVNFHDTRRNNKVPTGGFCENDHGGPLIVGQGKSSVVIGVMSACLTREISKKCYGPFLFTSVYRYRNLITCAIDKDLGAACRKLLRTSKTPMAETDFDWSNHKDDQKRAFGGKPIDLEMKSMGKPKIAREIQIVLRFFGICRQANKEIAPQKKAQGEAVEVLIDVQTKKVIPGASPYTKLPKK